MTFTTEQTYARAKELRAQDSDMSVADIAKTLNQEGHRMTNGDQVNAAFIYRALRTKAPRPGRSAGNGVTHRAGRSPAPSTAIAILRDRSLDDSKKVKMLTAYFDEAA